MKVCKECGGSDIETRAWVNPNTGIFISGMEDNDPIDNWCRDCENHVEFIDRDDKPKDSGDILSDSWLNKADDKTEREMK